MMHKGNQEVTFSFMESRGSTVEYQSVKQIQRTILEITNQKDMEFVS